MIPKRRYKRLSDADALAIVRRFHTGEATQRELEVEYGLTRGGASKLVHGECRPDIYAAVKAELEGNA